MQTTSSTTLHRTEHPAYVTKKIMVADETSRSTVKGLFWGLFGLESASATLTTGVATLYTLPFALLPPFTLVPISFGIATVILASITGSCINNCAYHFSRSDRQIVLIES